MQPRRGSILALALLAACAYAASAHGAVRIPDESWLQIGLYVAGLCAAGAWLARGSGPRTTREGWLGIALLTAFGAWCALTMLWSVAPDQSWLEANSSLSYALVVVLAAGLGTVSPAAIQRIALGWLLVASAVALYALARGCALFRPGGKGRPRCDPAGGADRPPAVAAAVLERARAGLRDGGAG